MACLRRTRQPIPGIQNTAAYVCNPRKKHKLMREFDRLSRKAKQRSNLFEVRWAGEHKKLFIDPGYFINISCLVPPTKASTSLPWFCRRGLFPQKCDWWDRKRKKDRDRKLLWKYQNHKFTLCLRVFFYSSCLVSKNRCQLDSSIPIRVFQKFLQLLPWMLSSPR